MSQEQRRKITTITTSRTSSSYGASSRSGFGYWVPLAITVTAATLALGAWIWSERTDEEESESETEQYYASANKPSGSHGGGLAGAAAAAGAAGAAAGYVGSHMSGGLPPGPGPAGQQPPPPGSFAPQPPLQGGFQGPPPGSMPPPAGGEAASFFRQDGQSRAMSTGVTNTQQEETSFITRMSNAVGLSSVEGAGRTNSNAGGWAGTLAAAGSMVGGAVKAVRGSAEDSQGFSDQEKWSEEADKPERTTSPRKSHSSVAGAALGAAGAVGTAEGMRGLQRRGTAAEFYSGAIDAPKRSSAAKMKRRTVAVVVSAVDKPDDGIEVDAHQVSYSNTLQSQSTNMS